MDEEKKLDDILKERLQELPKAVRDAIASAELEKKLQELAERHKLHLDKWDALENEVMLTLLGLESIDKLEENIKNEVGVPAETASALAEDIAEKIKMILSDESLKSRLTLNGRKLVEEKYTWDKIAVKFKELYDKFSI